jgi:cell wall-associated NlpC family hydrolase
VIYSRRHWSQTSLSVVEFAEQELGKEYVFGAAGPDVWDCSGLTMRAWATVGVELIHNALEQHGQTLRVYQTGRRLTPGDLVFYYQPISHVSIYTGHDRRGRRMVVAASAPGLGVERIPIDIYARPVSFGLPHS